MTELSLVRASHDTGGEHPWAFARLETALAALLGSGDAGAIDMVDTALSQAVLHRASDIHIEPWEDCVALRYRIDGLLHEVASVPHKYHGHIAGRVKVLARIVTYQKDVPQDGRIDPEATPCGKAMRVSTFPTVYGEKMVIRLLDADPGLFAVDALGFEPDIAAALRALVARPQGTLLLTGPASSGKTTTIYALLKGLLDTHPPIPHVVTIEDPVEYRLGRVSQSQIDPHAGFTFEAALRAVLRQDPEVIMLGEIRDTETARAAIQAGLTGHLVISTIHSGTAAGVFARLLDMCIEPFLIASSITGVLAQRLVRRNCRHCTEEYVPDPALVTRFGLTDPDLVFKHGAGCGECQGIGYRGREAIGELLLVDESVSDLILTRPRTHTLHEAALNAGMKPLAASAAARARKGVTTLEEIRRVLPAPQRDRPTMQDARKEKQEVRSKKRKAGFSLVELMAALFVLSVGLFGAVQSYNVGLDKIRVLREECLAARIVQNEVETLRALPFAQLADREKAPFVSKPSGLVLLHNAAPAVTVHPHADPGLALKEVSVSLRWTGEHGRTMEKAVTTLIADRAPSNGGVREP